MAELAISLGFLTVVLAFSLYGVTRQLQRIADALKLQK